MFGFQMDMTEGIEMMDVRVSREKYEGSVMETTVWDRVAVGVALVLTGLVVLMSCGCVSDSAYRAAGVHAAVMDGYVGDLERGELTEEEAREAIVAAWVGFGAMDLYLNGEELSALQAEAVERLQEGESGSEVFGEILERLLGSESPVR